MGWVLRDEGRFREIVAMPWLLTPARGRGPLSVDAHKPAKNQSREGSHRIPPNLVSDAVDDTIESKLMKSTSGDNEHLWRFMTNHAHVLECIAADPAARLRDIAASVDITERTAAQIVNELERAGYLTKTRNGRRNHYEVHDELPLRHPLHRHHTVGDLIGFLEGPAAKRQGGSSKTTRRS
jgi:hypothetical protein